MRTFRARFQAAAKDDDPLVRIFDDVDVVAEIHDVGRRTLFVGKERRIPAGHGNPRPVQPQQIVPTTAAVVEEGAVLANEPVVDGEPHGAG